LTVLAKTAAPQARVTEMRASDLELFGTAKARNRMNDDCAGLADYAGWENYPDFLLAISFVAM
jgi:hypothetical protein